MSALNKRDDYGWVAVTLHWLLFLLLVGLVASGKYSESLSVGSKNTALIDIHKQVGIAVFMLMMFRLLWRLINITPQAIATNILARLTAFLVHWILYIVVLAQALIGVLMTQLAGRNVVFLDTMKIPSMTKYAREFLEFMPENIVGDGSPARQMAELHHLGATAIISLVAVHAGIALAHHIFWGDDTLRRIFYGYVPAYAKKKISEFDRK